MLIDHEALLKRVAYLPHPHSNGWLDKYPWLTIIAEHSCSFLTKSSKILKHLLWIAMSEPYYEAHVSTLDISTPWTYKDYEDHARDYIDVFPSPIFSHLLQGLWSRNAAPTFPGREVQVLPVEIRRFTRFLRDPRREAQLRFLLEHLELLKRGTLKSGALSINTWEHLRTMFDDWSMIVEEV